MNALKKIQDGSDKAHRKIATKGLREYSLDIYQQTATNPLLGDGSTSILIKTLDPQPYIQNVSLAFVNASGGLIRMGDIRVTQITRRLDIQAYIEDPSIFWRLTGPAFAGDYSVVGGSIHMKIAQWQLVLRKLLAT